MIAEVLLLLAGHQSSLFPSDHTLHPAFVPLLHPGEQQCLESLGLTAYRYRQICAACTRLSQTPSRYISVLCSRLRQILRDEYEALVVTTEARVLARDPGLVSVRAFVPLSAVRAAFAPWDAPLAALLALVQHLDSKPSWAPGLLIDLLMERARTGVHAVADIFSRLSIAIQRAWRTQLIALLVHGTLAPTDPLAGNDFALLEGSVPSCVSPVARDSISYVGRAVGTVKAAKWQKQLPRQLGAEYTKMLEQVLPEDQYAFDRVILDIRASVGEWLWLNVLTRQDVEDAVNSLADYFLLRNGEFSLSFIRELEQLKLARLTARSGSSPGIIREQDLHLALLRASLGTTAQHDPSLSYIHCQLPAGPLRPLLPSLSNAPTTKGRSNPHQSLFADGSAPTPFDDLLLGTPLILTYTVTWPLNLFLQPPELSTYAVLFSYLSAIRRTHTRVHGCWAALSNAQRARRRWTGLSEGGTAEDATLRAGLLRCGWGIVRAMTWFLDTLLGYVMTDVVEAEFRRLKTLLANPSGIADAGLSTSQTAGSAHLDFTTLRTIHATYLERLLAGSLLANPASTAIIRPILEVCERFVAQVERWGGDVLPALLFEGSLGSGVHSDVGSLVRERWRIVTDINETMHSLLRSFYEQLTQSTTQQPFAATTDASKSAMYNLTAANLTTGLSSTFLRTKSGGKGADADAEVLRHVERLLLRLDFNGGFSKADAGDVEYDGASDGEQILKQGGLA